MQFASAAKAQNLEPSAFSMQPLHVERDNYNKNDKNRLDFLFLEKR